MLYIPSADYGSQFHELVGGSMTATKQMCTRIPLQCQTNASSRIVRPMRPTRKHLIPVIPGACCLSLRHQRLDTIYIYILRSSCSNTHSNGKQTRTHALTSTRRLAIRTGWRPSANRDSAVRVSVRTAATPPRFCPRIVVREMSKVMRAMCRLFGVCVCCACVSSSCSIL